MRYSGSEKLEIIKLVEQSTLSVCRTLASIGIPRSTFYDWYSRYQDGGIEALEDGRPRPLRVCAVTRRRFPVGASPTRQPLQPEATGAVMEATKWLKPPVSVSSSLT